MTPAQQHRPLPTGPGSVDVQLLDGGSFTANFDMVHAGSPDEPYRCHSWAFYIYHKATGQRIIHHHWDHSRPIKGMFPNAMGYFGPGTFAHCTPGQFHDEAYSDKGRWDANFFHPEKATENCKELQGSWQPFGPFENALDFLGDGSFWIIQAPGHMAGNLAAAARLSDGSWVILASDCCHSKALLEGNEDFQTWKGPQGEVESLHEDLCAARETVRKIRMLETNYGAHVALAHDSSWMVSGTDKVLMSLLQKEMQDFATVGLPRGEYP
ncbi:hypothetical protein ACJ41O_001464 [Fusarium nematophilum]